MRSLVPWEENVGATRWTWNFLSEARLASRDASEEDDDDEATDVSVNRKIKKKKKKKQEAMVLVLPPSPTWADSG